MIYMYNRYYIYLVYYIYSYTTYTSHGTLLHLKLRFKWQATTSHSLRFASTWPAYRRDFTHYTFFSQASGLKEANEVKSVVAMRREGARPVNGVGTPREQGSGEQGQFPTKGRFSNETNEKFVCLKNPLL